MLPQHREYYVTSWSKLSTVIRSHALTGFPALASTRLLHYVRVVDFCSGCCEKPFIA